jgi:cell wall-associated NlpC family hydrolase
MQRGDLSDSARVAKAKAKSSLAGGPGQVLALQRLVGNRVVSRLLGRQEGADDRQFTAKGSLRERVVAVARDWESTAEVIVIPTQTKNVGGKPKVVPEHRELWNLMHPYAPADRDTSTTSTKTEDTGHGELISVDEAEASCMSVDCSGLVRQVFSEAGFPIPGDMSASDLYLQAAPVDASAARPGDLVFWWNKEKKHIKHVGIYIGGQKLIAAGSHGVTIQNVWTEADEPLAGYGDILQGQ